MNEMRKGVVKFYNVGRSYGFIIEEGTGIEYFCFNGNLIDHIKKFDKVTFEADVVTDPRGPIAINVRRDI